MMRKFNHGPCPILGKRVPKAIISIVVFAASCHASCFLPAWNSAFRKNANGWFGNNNGETSVQSQPQPQSQQPPPSHVHLLILPGFGNEALDYTKEGSLVEALRKRNWSKEQIHVVPLNRFDWLLVFAKGLWDKEFRQGQADPTRPAFQWYLYRVAAQIDKIIKQEKNGSNNSNNSNNKIDGTATEQPPPPRQIILLGHSAGGWLARAAVGFCGVDDSSSSSSSSSSNAEGSPPAIPLDRIMGIVTLGAPNQPPPPGIMDMTQGALTITCQQFPSALYFTNRDMFYMTVIGNAIRGIPQQRKSFMEPSTPTGFAYESYRTVCGTGDIMGDGVVPTGFGHIDKSVQITLDGVYHSMNEPKRWYGADAKLDLWHDSMLQLMNKQMTPQTPNNNNNKSNSNGISQLLTAGELLWSFKK